MKFNTNLTVYKYTVNDKNKNNNWAFVCPELFQKEQFRNLKGYILGTNFGKQFPKTPLVRNTGGEGDYEVMIDDFFDFKVEEVIADPISLRGIVLKEQFPEQWLKRVLEELLIPQEEITISSWTEFVKGRKLLDEIKQEEEYI